MHGGRESWRGMVAMTPPRSRLWPRAVRRGVRAKKPNYLARTLTSWGVSVPLCRYTSSWTDGEWACLFPTWVATPAVQVRVYLPRRLAVVGLLPLLGRLPAWRWCEGGGGEAARRWAPLPQGPRAWVPTDCSLSLACQSYCSARDCVPSAGRLVLPGGAQTLVVFYGDTVWMIMGGAAAPEGYSLQAFLRS